MKDPLKIVSVFFIAFAVMVVGFFIVKDSVQKEHEEGIAETSPEEFSVYKKRMRGGDTSKKPTEWFTLSRAYPYDQIPHEQYIQALERAVDLREATANSEYFTVTQAGPVNVGGRITSVAVHPSNTNIIYAGAALGGIWKTTDGGNSWQFVSEDVPSLSVGDVVLDPQNPEKLYFGTGEANSSGDSYEGTGVYRSNDGGVTWQFLGLENSRHIGRILVSPVDSNRIYVAAMGSLFGVNPERGLYMSTDGGMNWERKLFINDTTGCVDVVMNPQNTNILYAAMWQRIRKPDYRNVGGLGTGIYKSTDGGNNWTEMTNGLPLHSATNGRIGLAIAPSNPNIVYASYTDHPGDFLGLWRTTDGGNTWSSRLQSPSPSNFSNFGWYFGQLWTSPTNADVVYIGDVSLWKSSDGGSNFNTVGDVMHVDHHAMYISPSNPQFMVEGNDGGLYVSLNGGTSWTKFENLPITQFYAITIDKLTSQRLYGGTQDNSTPRTLTGNLDDWDVLFYGDGFYTNVDYDNSNIIYAEAQYGYLGKSTNCGNSFDIIFTNSSHGERTNWSTPVVMSPHDNQVLFYGAQRVWKTTNGGSSWNAISPDLTGGSGSGNLVYGTITTISQSQVNPSVVWAGTDDSRVWVTTNGGSSWTMVSQNLPDRWCTRVTADFSNPAKCYVSFSGYKIGEHLPHIFVTQDYGLNWTDISGNLGEIPVNDIIPDPQISGRLYAGTDFGLYYTVDGGNTWMVVGDHPICPVFDIDLHDGQRFLVSGTHGMSMFKMLIPVSTVEETPVQPETGVFVESVVPEPFEEYSVLKLGLRVHSDVSVDLYDVNGRKVQMVFEGSLEPGSHTFRIEGEKLPAGSYFLSIRQNEIRISRRITCIK
ncbi:hypothetical protein JXA84_08775 [candidate division WOR-3 bacterium]|nr:hypothetical protein [candidate division WOR-3 bacterium]